VVTAAAHHLPGPPDDAVRARHPGAQSRRTIIFDVKCSQRLPVVIREAGGVPLMWKTGHSLIKAKLKETGAPMPAK
jgi:phosphomannomutase